MLSKLVEISDGFAGTHPEGAARDITIQAVIHGDNIVPLSKTAPEKIEALRTWDRERAVPASGIS